MILPHLDIISIVKQFHCVFTSRFTSQKLKKWSFFMNERIVISLWFLLHRPVHREREREKKTTKSCVKGKQKNKQRGILVFELDKRLHWRKKKSKYELWFFVGIQSIGFLRFVKDDTHSCNVTNTTQYDNNYFFLLRLDFSSLRFFFFTS